MIYQKISRIIPQMAERAPIPNAGTHISAEGKMYLDGVEQTRENFNKNIAWKCAPSENVLSAIAKVDRREFAPEEYKPFAYFDQVIPLEGASISWPSITAKMIDCLDLTGYGYVLEVGTASGYTAAILSELAERVDTIERNETLACKAIDLLAKQRITNVDVHVGDGAAGYVSRSPYDAIIVTAAVKHIPKQLEAQLAEGGRIVAPVGTDPEKTFLTVSKKVKGKLISTQLDQVWFMPLISNLSGGWRSQRQFEAASKAGIERKKLADESLIEKIADIIGIQPSALQYAIQKLESEHK